MSLILNDENDVYKFRECDVYKNKKNNTTEKKIYGSLYGKFNISDTVKIVSVGNIYSNYRAVFLAMRLNEKYWKDGYICETNNNIGIIVGRKIHECGGTLLYGVQLFKNDKIIIINEDGIKLQEGFFKFNNEDFEL